jgi:hypothetical protein
MKKFHQYFQDSQNIAKFLGTNSPGFPTHICWYPSAGLDFRHIAYFEFFDNPWFQPTDKPTIYIFTDHNLDNEINTPFQTNCILYQDNRNGQERQIKIKLSQEIQLKQPFYSPNTSLLHSERDKYSGKVFLVILELYFHYLNRKCIVEVPIVYFAHENMDFLFNFLLKYQIHVNYLIHINDGGGSIGGSNAPMNFIYRFQDLLKITNVISDQTIDNRIQFTEYSIDMMEIYLRSQQLINPYVLSRITDNLYKNVEQNKWKEERISNSAYTGKWIRGNQELPFYKWRRIQKS